MSYRKPFLSVTGPDGTEQVTVWGSRLIGVKIVTRFVDDHDECTFMFSNGAPYADDPGENTPYTVKIGWSATSASIAGTYYLSRIEYSGSPQAGEQVHYICRSGLTADLDMAGSQHFGADNGNNTMKDVFSNLFKNFGVDVVVSDRVANLPLPGGHLLQWQQSNIDFATDVANQVGAIIKPMGGKIIVLDRNAAESASGQSLMPVFIDRPSCYQYNVDLEPRFQYKAASSAYFDADAGRNKVAATADSGGSGAKDFLPHPAPDQSSASVFAKARADEYKRFTGTGIFIIAGEPNAVAGAKVICTKFPRAVNSVAWLAAEVTHDVEPGRGWTTTVETETEAA